MNTFKGAMAFLLTAMDGMRNRMPKEDVPGTHGTGPKATKRGATHVVNPTFLSVPGEVSPAQYRREHRGARGKKSG